MKEYYIHPKHARRPKLLVQIEGVMYDLKASEDSTAKTRGNKLAPEQNIPVKGVTQEFLAELLDNKEKYGDFSRLILVREVTEEQVAAREALLQEAEENDILENTDA